MRRPNRSRKVIPHPPVTKCTRVGPGSGGEGPRSLIKSRFVSLSLDSVSVESHLKTLWLQRSLSCLTNITIFFFGETGETKAWTLSSTAHCRTVARSQGRKNRMSKSAPSFAEGFGGRAVRSSCALLFLRGDRSSLFSENRSSHRLTRG